MMFGKAVLLGSAAASIILLMLWTTPVQSGPTRRATQCLKTGDLCVPMIMRVFGNQFANEAYCCNTTCVPIPFPMYGYCSRFIPQLGLPGSGSPLGILSSVTGAVSSGSSSSSSSSSSPSSDQRDSLNSFY